jgi:hypothetical protein
MRNGVGDARPLDTATVEKLYVNTLKQENIIDDVDSLAKDLVEHECICERHRKYIMTEIGGMDKNRLLVEVLTRTSVENYKVFVERLKSRQPYLAALLQIDHTG